MTKDKRPISKLKARYKLFYIFSVIALAVLFFVNFGIIYTLIVTPPDDPTIMMRFVYLIMVAGFFILAAQALLVFTRLFFLLGRDSEAMEDMKIGRAHV